MARFFGRPDFSHDSTPAIGILVTNLGTPDAPETGAVRRYLAEFLADSRVVETPRLLWWLILHGIILRLRPRRSAHAYRKIWRPEGSPLLVLSQRLTEHLQAALRERTGSSAQVALGMRYGTPSIAAALQDLGECNVDRLLVLPLYPQYSAATTGSTFDAVSRTLRRWRWIPELRFVTGYHTHPAYLDALCRTVQAWWQRHGRGQRLLMSFHGIPKDYFLAGDPYFCQCQRTARELAERLSLSEEQWAISFQSRFGPREWLRPYTDETLQTWGAEKTQRVDVVCPGFSVDCLETLEEIEMQNAELFRAAGGGELRYIPALNDSAEHVQALTTILSDGLSGWSAAEKDPARAERYAQLRTTLYGSG